MFIKGLRIHDDGTTIDAVAIKLTPVPNSDEWPMLIDRHGHPANGEAVFLMTLHPEACTTDPYHWPALGVFPNTLPVVHSYLINNWEHLPDGTVQEINVADLLDAPLYPVVRQDGMPEEDET